MGGLALRHPVTASWETDIIYFSNAGWHQADPHEPLKAIWKRAFWWGGLHPIMRHLRVGKEGEHSEEWQDGTCATYAAGRKNNEGELFSFCDNQFQFNYSICIYGAHCKSKYHIPADTGESSSNPDEACWIWSCSLGLGLLSGPRPTLAQGGGAPAHPVHRFSTFSGLNMYQAWLFFFFFFFHVADMKIV